MNILEIEIYGNNDEFKEDEFDIYVNDSNYNCEESYTVIGLDAARKKAKSLSRKYKVPVRENI